MRRIALWLIGVLMLALAANISCAESALAALGKDYTFPNKVDGLPTKLSDFPGLQINSFVTSDGVMLTYWEAGTGKPLIFLPGWTSNGAEYINVMYLLSQHYHVYVLDHRNQGLSQRVDYGNRIARFATDFNEFIDHLGLKSVDVCGHSMGSSVLWSYIDQYGSGAIHKAVFVDEPISITSRPWWAEDEKKQYGILVANPADLVQMGTQFLMPPASAPNKSDGPRFSNAGQSTPAFENSVSFASQVVKNDPTYMLKVLYDHGANDWHDVILQKIHVPVAIFSGDISPNLASQKWAHSVLKGSTFYVFSKEEGGDHLLMFRNPAKFAHDLQTFLQDEAEAGATQHTSSGVETHEILRTTTAWDGTPYATYPTGIAEPVVAKVTIPANGEITWHSHPVPNFAYVLSGEITVEDDKGNRHHFTAGEVMPELVRTAYHGIVGDQPATFIIFYTATKGMPLSQPASKPVN